MKKRIVAFVSTVSMIITMLGNMAISMSALTDYPLARDLTAFPEERAFYVETHTDFETISTVVNGGNSLRGYTFIQQEDVVLKGEWTPIGTIATPFGGTFDGNGYTISGLKTRSTDNYQGLFGVNEGVIRNVTLAEDCTVFANANAGAIAGRNNGEITDCISRAQVGFFPEATAGASYRILSQNLCIWGDDSFASAGSDTSRRPGIIQRINNSDPDIILFQELSYHTRSYTANGTTVTVDSWHDYLSENLSGYKIYSVNRSATPDEGVGVGYDPKKFKVLKKGCFWLSENPDAPVEEQEPAWGSGCRRNCIWMVLEDRQTLEQIAVYSVHLDYANETARINGANVILEKIAAMRQEFPQALVVIGGDYNTYATAGGYLKFAEELEDCRTIAETKINDVGSTSDLTTNTVKTTTIDYIMAEGSDVAVSEYQVLTDAYNGLLPSDHNGILVTFRAATDSRIGGIVGENNSTVARVIAEGSAAGTNNSGLLIGANNGSIEMGFCTDTATAVGGGSGSAKELHSLPSSPSEQVLHLLNTHAGFAAFTIKDGKYAVVGEGEGSYPVKVTLNGAVEYAPAGSTFTPDLSGYEAPSIIKDGSFTESTSFLLEPADTEIIIAEKISAISSAVTGGDYTVADLNDWIYLCTNTALFNAADVTIHLKGDIDLSQYSAFAGFLNVKFSLDGHGHTIKNWGTASAPISARGLFATTAAGGAMQSLKNFTLENCHLSGNGRGSALVYGFTSTNAGLAGIPAAFTMENVHVKNSGFVSYAADDQAILVAKYASSEYATTLNILNCSIEDTAMNAQSKAHSGGAVGKICNTSKKLTCNIQDLYLRNFDITNAHTQTGLVFGTVEGSNASATVNNVGAFNCSIRAGSNALSLIGANHSGGALTIRNSMFAGNTLSGTAGQYMIGCLSGSPASTSINHTNICDIEALAGEYDATALSGCVVGITGKYVTYKSADAFASGEAAYLVNAELDQRGNAAFYWKTENGNTLPASLEESTAGVLLKRDGTNTEALYGEKYGTLDLSDHIADGDAAYIESGSGVIENGILTLQGARSTVVALITAGQAGLDVADALSYFNGKNLSYYAESEALEASIAAIRIRLANGTYTTDPSAATADLSALEGYRQYASPDEKGGNIPSITEYALYQDAPHLSIRSMEEWSYLLENLSAFNHEDLTLYLGCDIDLGDFEGFSGFMNVKFSFDGGGHTLKNWGTAASPVSARGLFATTAAGGAMQSLKNFTLENCYLSGNGRGSALVYGFTSTNVGLAGIPATFTMENVHVKNSGFVSYATDDQAILVAKYASSEYATTLNILNCSIEDTTMNAGGKAHSGGAVGKICNTSKTLTCNIQDLYLRNFDITNAHTQTGFAFGTVEGSNASAYVNNVGIFESSINAGSNRASLIGANHSGYLQVRNSMFYHNTLTSSAGRFMVGIADTTNYSQANTSINHTNLCDDESLSAQYTDGATVGCVYGISGKYITHKTAEAFTSGEAPTLINSQLGLGRDRYWSMQDGRIYPSGIFSALCKVTVKVGDEAVDTRYVNGGTVIDLCHPEDPDATYSVAAGSGSRMNGSELLVSANGSETVVTIIPSVAGAFDAWDYPSVQSITEPVESGDYQISNWEDWKYANENAAYFNSTAVTLHLTGEIDLSQYSAFAGFLNVKFSLDGHGHTVKNWGTAASPISARGLFATTEAGGAMQSLKNFTLENCYLSGNGRGSALVYGFTSTNAGLAGIPATFTMENVHVKNSGFVSYATDDQAILVAKYASSEYATTLNILNCSIEDTTMNAQSKAHSGGAVGKICNTSKTLTCNIQDLYLRNFDIINAHTQTGFIFGTIEGGNASATVNNVGVFESSIRADSNALSLIGANHNGGALTIRNSMFAGNTLSGTAGQYMIGCLSGSPASTSINHTNICDIEALAGEYDATALSGCVVGITGKYVTYKSADAFEKGEAASLINEQLTQREAVAFYWTVEDGHTLPAKEEEAIHLVRLQKDGEIIATVCAPLGALIYLNNYISANEMVFAQSGGGYVEERKITVTEDYVATVEVISPDDPAASIAEVILYFEGKDLSYYANSSALSTLLQTAKARIASGVYDTDSALLSADLSALEGYKAYAAPSETGDNIPSVRAHGQYADSLHFAIKDAEDWMYVYENLSDFNQQSITLHLIGDIDLSHSVAGSFKGFLNAKFSLNGHGHTIKNWGSASAPISARGLFATTAAGGAMQSLKNFSLENCYLNGNGRGSALVYGFTSTNTGLAGIPATFTMEGVHVKNSGFVSYAADDQAILVAKYASSEYATVLNILNCSIEDTTMNAGGKAHSGGAVGKICNTSKTLTCNINGIYMRNFDITNAHTQTGFAFGTVEGSNASAYVNNVAVFESSINAGSNRATLIGANHSGYLQVRNCMFRNNTLTSSAGRFMVGIADTATYSLANTSINHTNICDDESLSAQYATGATAGCVYGVSGKYVTYKADDAFANGEVIGIINGQLGGDTAYWILSNGKIIPAA